MVKILDELSKKSRPFWVLGFLLLCFAIPTALKLSPLDRDEARFMQATTQMFENGDFITINFQDEQRNKKPIGIHWLQASILKITGQGLSHNPFYFRIASILGAYLAIIATFLIGARLFDRKTGMLAGLLLASSLLLTTEAHIAKTDASLAGFIALSFYALAEIRFKTASKKNILLFWFAFGVAVLIKGPVPIMVFGLMVLLLWALEKNISWIKPLFNLQGIILFFIITLPWFILIGIKTDWQFYVEAIGKDLGEKVTGKQENSSLPPGLHTLISPIILWPASLGLGAALMMVIKNFNDIRIKFLCAIIIPTWLVFELSTGKLAHYTLPVHFAICLLIAFAISNNYWHNWGKWLGVGIFLFATILISAIPIYLGFEYFLGKTLKFDFNHALQNTTFKNTMIISLLILSVSFIGLIAAIKNQKIALPILLLAGFIFSFNVKAQILPSIYQLNMSKNISQKLLELGLNPLNNPQKLALIGAGYQEPSLIFLTRSDSYLASIEIAKKHAQLNSPFVVEEKEWNNFQREMLKLGFKSAEKNEPLRGLNYSKGDDIIIHIGVLTKATAP